MTMLGTKVTVISTKRNTLIHMRRMVHTYSRLYKGGMLVLPPVRPTMRNMEMRLKCSRLV